MVSKPANNAGHTPADQRNAKIPDSDRKGNLDKVIPVRLPGDKWDQIKEVARELGVSASTLCRIWILESFHARMIGNHKRRNGSVSQK